ncbi:MAG: hypothetical protein ACI93R_002024 [Flavobacteriales bacterium]|jgi:hypothetical protein
MACAVFFNVNPRHILRAMFLNYIAGTLLCEMGGYLKQTQLRRSDFVER